MYIYIYTYIYTCIHIYIYMENDDHLLESGIPQFQTKPYVSAIMPDMTMIGRRFNIYTLLRQNFLTLSHHLVTRSMLWLICGWLPSQTPRSKRTNTSRKGWKMGGTTLPSAICKWAAVVFGLGYLMVIHWESRNPWITNFRDPQKGGNSGEAQCHEPGRKRIGEPVVSEFSPFWLS